jgi:hypothetical protein
VKVSEHPFSSSSDLAIELWLPPVADKTSKNGLSAPEP